MLAILPPPLTQFIDANGHPYAGGKIFTYIPGTSTPKATYTDDNGGTPNTNPIVLDMAGRAGIFGDGLYRFVVEDAEGNLVYDDVTSSLVSQAMAPVVIAADLATARAAMGVTGAIQAEALIRFQADQALEAGLLLTAQQSALDAEATTRAAADTALTAALAAETAARIAGTGDLFRAGIAVADSSGHVRVTFAPAFPTACTACVATLTGGGFVSDTTNTSFDRFGVDIWVMFAGTTTPKADTVSYIAIGN